MLVCTHLIQSLHEVCTVVLHFVAMPDLTKSLQTVAREAEVGAEDEQAFLARHLVQLQAGGTGSPHAPQGRQESPLRQSPAVQKTNERRVSTGVPPNQIGSPKKVSFDLFYFSFCSFLTCHLIKAWLAFPFSVSCIYRIIIRNRVQHWVFQIEGIFGYCLKFMKFASKTGS